MSLYVMISPGNAPGTSTTAMAVSACWPGPVITAECDPAGGTVIPRQASRTARVSPNLPTIKDLAARLRRGGGPEVVGEYLQTLNTARQWFLLPGLWHPRHVSELDGAWELLGKVLAGCEMDVVADAGRVGGRDAPYQLLGVADLVVMVIRPEFEQVYAAQQRIEMLRQSIDPPLAMVLSGEGRYTPAAVRKALSVGVLGQLPDDPDAAAAVSAGTRTKGFAKSSLIRAARVLAEEMSGYLDRRDRP